MCIVTMYVIDSIRLDIDLHTFIDAANGLVLFGALGIHPRGVSVSEVDTPSFRSVGLIVAPVGVRH